MPLSWIWYRYLINVQRISFDNWRKLSLLILYPTILLELFIQWYQLKRSNEKSKHEIWLGSIFNPPLGATSARLSEITLKTLSSQKICFNYSRFNSAYMSFQSYWNRIIRFKRYKFQFKTQPTMQFAKYQNLLKMKKNFCEMTWITKLRKWMP